MSFVQLVLSSSSGFTAPNAEALNCRLSASVHDAFLRGGTGEKHFHGVLLHVKLREIILLADGKFCPESSELALTGQDTEGALQGIFRGSNGDFTVPEPETAR